MIPAETAEKADVPVHDSSSKMQPVLVPIKAHLLDVLSNPLPFSARATNQRKPRPVVKQLKKKFKKPTHEELLIEFSSCSGSQESVFVNNRSQEADKAAQLELPTAEIRNLTLEGNYIHITT